MTDNIKTWPKSSLTDAELLDNYWNQDHNNGTKLADDLRPVANAAAQRAIEDYIQPKVNMTNNKIPEKVYIRIQTWSMTGLEVTTNTDNTGHEYIRADIVNQMIKNAYMRAILFMDNTPELRS